MARPLALFLPRDDLKKPVDLRPAIVYLAERQYIVEFRGFLVPALDLATLSIKLT